MFQLIFEKILQSTGRTSYTMVMQIVGQIIAMLLGLYFNLAKNKDVPFQLKSIKLESHYFKGICAVGIPTISDRKQLSNTPGGYLPIHILHSSYYFFHGLKSPWEACSFP